MLPATRYVGHGTVLLRLGGLTVATDPVYGRTCSGLTRIGRPTPVPLVDVVVVSHLHADHLHLPTLRRLRARSVVVPRGAGAFVRRHGVSGVVELGVGESREVGDVRITGIDAAHDDHRWPFAPGSTRAHPLGYLLEDHASRVYFAGDTDLLAAMGGLGEPDLALLPVWGWGPDLGPGHLDPAGAAEATRLIAPATVLPIHWGTFAPPAYAWRMRRQLREPPRLLRTLAATAAPHTRVAVVEPGDLLSSLGP